ncbi:MAG: Energy-coupling factor transporter transmembrane protein EcfT [Pelotomaculum sp. PtaB.Bin104]|nr:MAG: Energy-coupling factor transporter transmembrane protein EcfT [Pelotomaculum sp. PtaB.Bin104]
MFQKFFYQEKGLFLQSLHPATSLTLIAALFFLALSFSHPCYLLGLLLVILLSLWAADGLDAWEGYLKAVLWIVLLIMLINALVNHNGSTVLLRSPELPLVGRLSVTMEAISYGAAMGVRLLDVVSAFCLFNLIVHPDRFFGLFSTFARKSALVVSLATRLFPLLLATLGKLREAQQLRGVDFNQGTLRERATKSASLFNLLLLSALEDSLQMAEAMQARAFGSGPRSRYRRDPFRPRDGICLAGLGFALVMSVYSLTRGMGSYTYFPELDSLWGGQSLLALLALLLGLTLPALLSWGCQHWHYLNSKI